MFSVIIPTLQRSPELWPLVDQCAQHPLVFEVLVINNARETLSWTHDNVRVLDQHSNIFVNPAWNLGVSEARAEWVAIINDDVRFKDEALSHAARILRSRHFGIVAPDRSCFAPGSTHHGVRHRVASFGNYYFGTFMCLRKDDYVRIPEEMQIWGGDDWLFTQQRKPSAVLIDTPFVTEMSTTTSSPEIARMRDAEQAICDQLLLPLYGTRWWHRPVSALAWARRTRHKLTEAISRKISRDRT